MRANANISRCRYRYTLTRYVRTSTISISEYLPPPFGTKESRSKSSKIFTKKYWIRLTHLTHSKDIPPKWLIQHTHKHTHTNAWTTLGENTKTHTKGFLMEKWISARTASGCACLCELFALYELYSTSQPHTHTLSHVCPVVISIHILMKSLNTEWRNELRIQHLLYLLHKIRGNTMSYDAICDAIKSRGKISQIVNVVGGSCSGHRNSSNGCNR